MSDASGDQVSLLDTLQDPGAPDPAAVMDATDLKDRIADAIARLPEREKLVVALYYYENLTLREIGEVLGVTESRVSQLHTKAVLRLRGRMSDENLADGRASRSQARPAHAAGRYFAVAVLASRLPEERSRGMHKPADRIRNVALIGHRGSGKTSLHEALLFEARRDEPPRDRCSTARRSPTPSPTSRRARCRSRWR